MSDLEKSTLEVTDEVLDYALKETLRLSAEAYRAQSTFDALVIERWGHHYSDSRTGLEDSEMEAETRAHAYKLGMGLEDDELVESIDHYTGREEPITIKEFIAKMDTLSESAEAEE